MRPETSSDQGRRIAALVLPDLPCELAEERDPARRKVPFGVLVTPAPGAEAEGAALYPQGVLVAVNEEARRLGVRPGQTPAEAQALLARLWVGEVGAHEIGRALEGICEMALGFGQPVSWQAPDTVWVDITGTAHLWGGESALAETWASQVRGWGHRVRVATAPGPHLARAFARWGNVSPAGTCIVPAEQTESWLEQLPLLALPLPTETVDWFARLGILNVGQLRALPRQSSSARLGREARLVLELCAGRDATPLVPYEPPPTLVEECRWDEALDRLDPLLFALRGLVARLSARLEGRGEAAQSLWLDLEPDTARPPLRLKFELAAPLWREEELERVLRARLERLQLTSPLVGLRLTAPALAARATRQLQLGRSRLSGQAAAWGALEGGQPEELSVLLAELAADVGAEHVGRLRWKPRHRPEHSSVLEPVQSLDESSRKASGAPVRGGIDGATRFLPRPIPLAAPLRDGELVGIGRQCFVIRRIRFVQRLEEVEWWTSEPVSRDYLRLWLEGPEGGLEALVFVDRGSGKRYLHAFVD